MKNWMESSLGVLLPLKYGKSLPANKRIEGDFPVYSSAGNTGSHNEPLVSGPCLIIGRKGSVGTVFYEENDCFPIDTAFYTTGTPEIDLRFGYYLLLYKQLFNYSQDSAVPGLNRDRYSEIPVSLPPLQEQRAIAEVLGALDDKITANNKASSQAIEIADSLFQKALSSAEISNQTFADISKVSGGGTPSTKKPEYWNGGVLWATPTDVTALTGPYLESTSRTISEEGLNACPSELYPAGTILMTSRATIGAFALTQAPTAVNQGFIVVQPSDPNLNYWIFHEMRSRVSQFSALANGATFLELSRGNFKKLKVRQAPYGVMKDFNEKAGTFHHLASTALSENRTLAAMRDTLLPQLMSGKIRVRDAESIVEDVL